MALLAVLSFQGTTWNLRCDTISHDFTRLGADSSLPASGESGAPQRFYLDLGVEMEQITISGLVNTNSSGAGDPAKEDLEDVCQTWWKYDSIDAASASNFPLLTINKTATNTYSYNVCMKNASFKKTGGTEDRWDFSITFAVVSPVRLVS